MKNMLISALLLCIRVSIADTSFAIGTESFRIEFPSTSYSESFKSFVAEDVARVFAPLRTISNVVDIAIVEACTEQSHPIIFREWYPEGFSGAWSVTNQSGSLVFRMSAPLARRYMDSYEWMAANTNKVFSLYALMDEINDHSITNRTAMQAMSLVFIPEQSTYHLTPEDASAFLQMLVQNAPFTVSILDFWEEQILGVTCIVAASKTAISEEGHLVFAPIEWVFWNGSWKFYHPSILETIPRYNCFQNE